MKASPHIIIVGGGLAGLAAALEVEKTQAKVSLFEGSDRIGGRIKTDQHKGFLLDHGFQVIQSAYPEVKPYLRRMQLKSFRSGVHTFHRGKWVSLLNPLRHPLAGLTRPSFLQLLPLLLKPAYLEESTAAFIQRCHMDSTLVEGFLYPFFRGVFLDDALSTDASLFKRYLRFFAWGKALLPEGGMQQLPYTLSQQLQCHPQLGAFVTDVTSRSITLANGKRIEGDRVILALDAPSLSQLMSVKKGRSCSSTTFYYQVQKNQLQIQPLLYLKAKSVLTTICFPNHIAASYAPKGYDLLSVSTLGSEDVKEEVCDLFKLSTHQLTDLKKISIAHALPDQSRLSTNSIEQEGLFVAGETVGVASINGAIQSGKEAARACLASL
ncbi:MAG: FAD-dependent oxidoreductase [Chlamydiae bacterium]|nr:hypothetical protein [Chlamydiales bacterium]MCH9703280.1 FAD-dependent oxidoreductase [Chlamydiota bacterium]